MSIGIGHYELSQIMEIFGESRSKQGDIFGENRRIPAELYYYVTAGTLTSALVWGSAGKPTLSIFSCARADMNPTLELYRYVSLWRTTFGFAAPYVVELNGRAAVMCERQLSGKDFYNDDVLARHVAVTMDLVSDMSGMLANDLSRADGTRLEDKNIDVETSQLELHEYWSVSDRRISRIIGLD